MKALFNKLYRFILGVDIFISYSRRDARVYAEKLAVLLQDENYKCYIDKWKSQPGKNNSHTIRTTLRHSSMLVILSTENAVLSPSVGYEVTEFIKTGRDIVPIDFGHIRVAAWYPAIRGLALSDDTNENLKSGEPDTLVVKRIINSFRYQKQSTRLRVAALSTLAILVIMIGLITFSAFQLSNIRQQKKDLSAEIKVETADQLLALGQSYLDIDPAISLRLAQGAFTLNNENSDKVRNLVLASLYKNPVWLRKNFKSDNSNGELIPDLSAENDVFATDTAMNYAVIADSLDKRKIQLYDLAHQRVVSTLVLGLDEDFVAPNPSASNYFAIKKNSLSKNGFSVEIHEINPRTFLSVLANFNQVSCFQFAAGKAPCLVLRKDGQIFSWDPDVAGPKISLVTTIIDGRRIFVHPSGKSFCVVTGLLKSIWVGKNDQGTWSQKTLPLTGDNHWYYAFQGLFNPFIKWGANSWQLMALEISKQKVTRQTESHQLIKSAPGIPQYKTSSDRLIGEDQMQLVAIDARSLKKHILLTAPLFANGLSRPMLETDFKGNKVMLVVSDNAGGTFVQSVKLTWKDDPNNFVQAELKNEGALKADVKSQSETNVNALCVAPNGNYAIIATDTRGTSGTQNGLGEVSSWDLTSLDQTSSAKPEAGSIPLYKAHIKRIAYSCKSDKIAFFDLNGGLSVLKLRSDPVESFFNGTERFSHELYERLSPNIQVLGNNSEFWRVNYTDKDIRLYDLSDGSEINLTRILKDQKLLDLKIDDKLVTLVGSKSIMQFYNMKKLVKNINLSERIDSATICSSIITLHSPSKLLFYDTKSLNSIGYLKIDSSAFFHLVTFNSNYLSDNSFYLSCIDRQDGNIGLTAFAEDKWILRAFSINPKTAGSKEFVIKEKWNFPMPFPENPNRWYSARRLPSSGTLLLLEGDYTHEPSFFQIDIASGKVINKFKPPETAWPSKLFEICDYFNLDNERVAIVFRIVRTSAGSSYRQTFNIGIWPKNGGACLKWNNLGSGDEYLKGSRDQVNDVKFVQIKGMDKNLKIYDPESGRAIYNQPQGLSHLALADLLTNGSNQSEKLTRSFVYIKNGAIIAVDKSVLNSVNSKLNLGGGLSWIDDVTKIALPEAMQAKINSFLITQ